MNKGIDGVVLLFVDEHGKVIADAADFNRASPGGWTLREGQERRAGQALAFKVCAAYASPQLVRAIDIYAAERIVKVLCDKHGCKVQQVNIGHEEQGQ